MRYCGTTIYLLSLDSPSLTGSFRPNFFGSELFTHVPGRLTLGVSVGSLIPQLGALYVIYTQHSNKWVHTRRAETGNREHCISHVWERTR